MQHVYGGHSRVLYMGRARVYRVGHGKALRCVHVAASLNGESGASETFSIDPAFIRSTAD